MLIRFAFHPKACSKILRSWMKKIRAFKAPTARPASATLSDPHWRCSSSTRSRNRSKFNTRNVKVGHNPIRSSSASPKLNGDLPEYRRLKLRSRVHIKKAKASGPRLCRDRDNLRLPGNINECRRHSDFSSFMIRIGQEAACSGYGDYQSQESAVICSNLTKSSSQTCTDPLNDSSLDCRIRRSDSSAMCRGEKKTSDDGNMKEPRRNSDITILSLLGTDVEASSFGNHQKVNASFIPSNGDLETDLCNILEDREEADLNNFRRKIDQENGCNYGGLLLTKDSSLRMRRSNDLIIDSRNTNIQRRNNSLSDCVSRIIQETSSYDNERGDSCSISANGGSFPDTYTMITNSPADRRKESYLCKDQNNLFNSLLIDERKRRSRRWRRRRSQSDDSFSVAKIDRHSRSYGDSAEESPLCKDQENILTDPCSMNEQRKHDSMHSFREVTGLKSFRYEDQTENESISASHMRKKAYEGTLSSSSSSENNFGESGELYHSFESAGSKDNFAISGFYPSSFSSRDVGGDSVDSWIPENLNKEEDIQQGTVSGTLFSLIHNNSLTSRYENSSTASADTSSVLGNSLSIPEVSSSYNAELSGDSADLQITGLSSRYSLDSLNTSADFLLSALRPDSSSTPADFPSFELSSTQSLDSSTTCADLPLSEITSRYTSDASRASTDLQLSELSFRHMSNSSSTSADVSISDLSLIHRLDSSSVPANLQQLDISLTQIDSSCISAKPQKSDFSSDPRATSEISMRVQDPDPTSECRDFIFSSIGVDSSSDLSSLSILSTDLPISDVNSRHMGASVSSKLSTDLLKPESIYSGHMPLKSDKLSSMESLALVKMSENPAEDFRESMYEMMMTMIGNGSQEMEELLHRYLSLNSPQLHDLIEEVFCDVWCALF